MKITKGQFNLLQRAKNLSDAHSREAATALHVAQMSTQHLTELVSVVAGVEDIADGTKFEIKATPEGEYSLEMQAEVKKIDTTA